MRDRSATIKPHCIQYFWRNSKLHIYLWAYPTTIYSGTDAGPCSTAAQSSAANSSIVCQSPPSTNISPGNASNQVKTTVASISESKSRNANIVEPTLSKDERKDAIIDDSPMKLALGSRQPVLQSSLATATSATLNSGLVPEASIAK